MNSFTSDLNYKYLFIAAPAYLALISVAAGSPVGGDGLGIYYLLLWFLIANAVSGLIVGLLPLQGWRNNLVFALFLPIVMSLLWASMRMIIMYFKSPEMRSEFKWKDTTAIFFTLIPAAAYVVFFGLSRFGKLLFQAIRSGF